MVCYSVYKRGKTSTNAYKSVLDFDTRVLVIFGAYGVLKVTGFGNQLNFLNWFAAVEVSGVGIETGFSQVLPAGNGTNRLI